MTLSQTHTHPISWVTRDIGWVCFWLRFKKLIFTKLAYMQLYWFQSIKKYLGSRLRCPGTFLQHIVTYLRKSIFSWFFMIFHDFRWFKILRKIMVFGLPPWNRVLDHHVLVGFDKNWLHFRKLQQNWCLYAKTYGSEVVIKKVSFGGKKYLIFPRKRTFQRPTLIYIYLYIWSILASSYRISGKKDFFFPLC